MRLEKRDIIVIAFTFGVAASVTSVLVAFLGDKGPTPDGYLDAGTTVLLTVIVGYFLTRRVGINDEDDREKRLFAAQGIHKVRDCLDKLSVILDEAVHENAQVFPSTDKTTKHHLEKIKDEVTLLVDCLDKIQSGDSSVTRRKLDSILEQRQSLYDAWSEFGGSPLAPEKVGEIRSMIIVLNQDAARLYYDVVSRS